MTLVGVTLASLVAAIKAAGEQAQEMHEQHPESEVLDQIRLDLGHLYELVSFEATVWRRSGVEP